MKKQWTLLCLLCVSLCTAQPTSIDELGKAVTNALVANDSLQFYALAMPGEGMYEIFKAEMGSKMTEEQLATARKNMEKGYPELIRLSYGISFFTLTSKIGIFDLTFDDVVYEIQETKETREIENLVGVHGDIDHEKFKHITFYAYPYNGYWYLFSERVSITEENAFNTREELQTIQLSEDDDGYLQIEASFTLDGVKAPKSDRLSCLNTFPVNVGKTDISIGTSDNPELYLAGNWSFNYYVGPDDDPAGAISFDYRYTVEEDVINFRFSNFVHEQDDSEFASVGRLPRKANKQVLSSFSEVQYQEILYDVLMEARRGIRSRKNLVKRCLD
ncbi:MAG: hypothetical protein AAF466_05860 [Bacteroidota bacterium]